MGLQYDRNIETKYIISGSTPARDVEVKVTRAIKAGRAVARCIENMEYNAYGADYAEVWDLETGKIYAQVKFHKNGDITVWKNGRRPDLLHKLEKRPC
jgi:hypothetical protein